jgi:L-fuculose-phosphate aldolase
VTEAQARGELVAYGRRLYERGLVAGASGNLSVRLGDGTLLVTPSGRSLGTLRSGDIVACSSDGSARESDGRPTSELPLHLAAYRTRPEVRCIVHTHPTYCVAWSKTGRLFALDTVGAIESLGSIAWTRYAPSGTSELAAVCSQAFGAGFDTLVMERHGLTSIALDFETAFLRTDLAEQTAQIEFAAYLLGAPKPSADMQDERPAERSALSPPELPVSDLRTAAGDHPEARAAVDAFHAEFSGQSPDAARLHDHAERMRTYDNVAGPFERWWLDPRVQAFVAELNATGI